MRSDSAPTAHALARSIDPNGARARPSCFAGGGFRERCLHALLGSLNFKSDRFAAWLLAANVEHFEQQRARSGTVRGPPRCTEMMRHGVCEAAAEAACDYSERRSLLAAG